MIEVRNLSRSYGDFVAVRDVSFNIGHGEVVGLLGHNGAGKTTIMKMLTGFLEPGAGDALVDGERVEDEPKRAQALIGYLPEHLPLYPELTVTEYLEFAAQLRGINPVPAVARAIRATELMEKALDRISTLSRGYKQRVGVAQAILHNPAILILDEPTNGLDPSQTQQMRSLIRRLSDHATIILSTHIMQEVSAVCDRVLILRNGSLVVDKPLSELKHTRHLRLRSHKGADVVGAIGGLDCVERHTVNPDGSYTIEVSRNMDESAALIATAFAAKELPLFELAPVQRDLETVFREVNEDGAIESGAFDLPGAAVTPEVADAN